MFQSWPTRTHRSLMISPNQLPLGSYINWTVRTNNRHVSSSQRLGLKLNGAFAHGKDRMVLAHTDACAGMPLRASLTDNDVTGNDLLTAKLLDAKAPPFGVATVPG